jgi:Tfp pilus assembly protein PilV
VVKRRHRTTAGDQGFTLLEVLMAILVAMIGLLGTVAVQQVALRATMQGNDAIVAMRLATQRAEQFSAAATSAGPPVVDELAARAAETGAAVWSTPEYLDATGTCPGGTGSWSGTCRWRREWRVVNSGVGAPYNISVQVTYDMDGTPKVVRFDLERRKTF